MFNEKRFEKISFQKIKKQLLERATLMIII
jgi:hypothetical protein